MTTAAEREARRLARQAKALAIVKAIGTPEWHDEKAERAQLKHTEIVEATDAPGFVYFVYCARRIKIGFTTDVRNRMDSLATSCPFPMTLLLTIAGGLEDEEFYHDHFCESRAHLEWFRLTPDLREFLSSKFDVGTHELLANAEDQCDDQFLNNAAQVLEDREEIFF